MSVPPSSTAMLLRNSRPLQPQLTRPEIAAMSFATPRLQAAENPGARPTEGVASRLRGLFAPLDDLMICGGDPRLALDRARLNAYGCGPSPSPGTWSFAS